MKPSNNKGLAKQGFKGFKFLGFVIFLFILLYFVNASKTIDSLKYFTKNTLKVLPIFVLVIFLTALINYYFPKERIGQMLQGKSRWQTYTVSLLAGVISMGPIFAWFPLLKNLKDKNLEEGALVTFFYGKSIKLTLWPIMIGFFGQLFSLIFIFYIALAALMQGFLYALLFEKNQKE